MTANAEEGERSRAGEVVLIRHGETEWSRAGRHTGRTDVPLTARGRIDAERVGALLARREFALVLTSPALRSLETSRLAGFEAVARQRAELREWDYGDYEGRTTADIRELAPGWNLWDGGVPGGESVEEVGERADHIVTELRAAGGDALVFAHGHLLRVLGARWLGLEPRAGRLFALDPATVSVLGYEHGRPVVRAWNQLSGPARSGT